MSKPTDAESDKHGQDGGGVAKRKAASERLSISLPAPQNMALDRLSSDTGLSKNDLIRHAVAILNTSMEAKRRGLHLALVGDEDHGSRIVSPELGC